MPDPARDAGSTFDRIAEPFDATRARPWPFVERFLEALEVGGGPLVDVGCGNGRHLLVAALRGLRCVGVDASRRLLGIARTRAPAGTALLLADARRLPLRGSTAGAVLAVALLHHIPTRDGRAQAAAELARVARPGARVLASVWALDEPRVADRARAMPGGSPRDLLVPWHATEGAPVDRYYRAMTLAELRELLEGAGLEVMRARDEGDNHVAEAWRGG